MESLCQPFRNGASPCLQCYFVVLSVSVLRMHKICLMSARLSRRFSCIVLLRFLLLHTVRMTWRCVPCFLTRGILREHLREQYCV
jgi:hypothetical protein